MIHKYHSQFYTGIWIGYKIYDFLNIIAFFCGLANMKILANVLPFKKNIVIGPTVWS